MYKSTIATILGATIIGLAKKVGSLSSETDFVYTKDLTDYSTINENSFEWYLEQMKSDPDFIARERNNNIKFSLPVNWNTKSKVSLISKTIELMPSVERLDLRGLGLEYLPENIGILKNLTDLDLQSNKLTTLPKSIENLDKLEALFLDRNFFTKFPKNVLHLKNLTELNLNENPLLNIPKGITDLKKLQALNLRNRYTRTYVTNKNTMLLKKPLS